MPIPMSKYNSRIRNESDTSRIFMEAIKDILEDDHIVENPNSIKDLTPEEIIKNIQELMIKLRDMEDQVCIEMNNEEIWESIVHSVENFTVYIQSIIDSNEDLVRELKIVLDTKDTVMAENILDKYFYKYSQYSDTITGKNFYEALKDVLPNFYKLCDI